MSPELFNNANTVYIFLKTSEDKREKCLATDVERLAVVRPERINGNQFLNNKLLFPSISLFYKNN